MTDISAYLQRIRFQEKLIVRSCVGGKPAS